MTIKEKVRIYRLSGNQVSDDGNQCIPSSADPTSMRGAPSSGIFSKIGKKSMDPMPNQPEDTNGLYSKGNRRTADQMSDMRSPSRYYGKALIGEEARRAAAKPTKQVGISSTPDDTQRLTLATNSMFNSVNIHQQTKKPDTLALGHPHQKIRNNQSDKKSYNSSYSLGLGAINT